MGSARVPFKITALLVHVVEASPGRGQDRAGAEKTPSGHLLVLADGAGGTSGGAEAATRVVDGVFGADPRSAQACVDLLASLDDRLGGGETTAVLLRVADGVVFGASVGDSSAQMLRGGELVDLTKNQRRKPLLGSGRATVVAIEPVPLEGPVIVASDGLFSYVYHARILEILSRPFADISSALVKAAKLPAGGLQDDLSFVVCSVSESR